MFSVGLTGGIASGKTTVSDLFAEHSVPVIDTDIISRKLLSRDEQAYQQVRDHFGAQILQANGDIDRGALRRLVFADRQQKRWLETMLHPLIYQRSHQAIVKQTGAIYVLVVVPLLFETNFQSLVDRILVVDCPAEQQIRRLMKRDSIDQDLAQSMLDQQLGNAERIARGHDVIHNREDQSDLQEQVDALHASYLQMAQDR